MVKDAAVAVVDTAGAVGETAHVVVGTGAGVVIEILGGEGNGRTCPMADLTTHEKWIESLDPRLRLKDLVLPGVHHHGLVEGHGQYQGPIPGGKVLDWAVTQSLSVIDQLKTGARFLDIRLTKVNGRIFTAHGTDDKIVTLGVPFDELLDANLKFLRDNNKEFLVWTFMWEFGEPSWSEVEDIFDNNDEYFYTEEDPLEQPLSSLAGKIILCREGEDNLAEYRRLDCTGSWPVTRQKDPAQLVDNILEYAKEGEEGVFTYIEAVATIDAEGAIDSLNTFSTNADNLKDLACQVNKRLKEFFLIEENKNLTKNFHSIMVDYSVYHQVISGILHFNQYKSSFVHDE